jgi:hypothetical protein
VTWGSSKKIRKYCEGIRILGIVEMIAVLAAGRYVFVRGKPYHPAVLRNWSLASLEAACRYGARVAELTPEWIEDEEMKAMAIQEGAEGAHREFVEVGETR